MSSNPVLQTLNIIHTSFPRALTPHLHDLLNAAIHHLSVYYPTFNHYYLQQAAAIPHSSEDQTIELIHLVCPMLDFVSRIARSGRARDWFEGENFSNLINSVFSWVQMTHGDVSLRYFWCLIVQHLAEGSMAGRGMGGQRERVRRAGIGR